MTRSERNFRDHSSVNSRSTHPVVLEACGGAHYWARQMFGHEAEQLKPFVKRQKNAGGRGVIAAQRPEMRLFEPKTEEQQARGVPRTPCPPAN